MLESCGRGLYTSAAYTQVFTVKDAFYQANIVCCIFYDSVCSVEATLATNIIFLFCERQSPLDIEGLCGNLLCEYNISCFDLFETYIVK